jgi:hypothetical protein
MLPGGDRWRDEILEPLWRFPLPAAFALLATALNWDRPEYRLSPEAGQLPLTLFCIASFFWTWAAALWAEVQSDRVTGLLIGLGGAVLLALIFRIDLAVPFWLTNVPAAEAQGIVTISHALLLGALFLAPAFAPYLTRTASQSAFWQYNHKWTIGYLAAGIGSVLAFAGVVAVIGSAAMLLEVPVPRWIYGNIWLICAFLVLPWAWLALSPEDFREETKTGAQQEFTSRAVGLLVVYILIPVTFAMSAVLAAYVVKVIVEGSFSSARLGLMSVAYGAGFIVVMLMAWPQREHHGLVRLFWRAWPFLLIMPVVLLIPALWIRISEFGWTPSRYFALMLGLWIAGVMVVGFVMRSREDLRIVPGLLAALLMLGAFGPWGIADVSARSQFARLEGLLIAKGLLIDGRWRENHGPIAWDKLPAGQHIAPGTAVLVGDDDRRIASTALDVLATTGELDRLQPWFAGQSDDPFASREEAQTASDAINQKLALRGTLPTAAQAILDGSYIFFNVLNPATILLPGEPGTLIGPIGLTSILPRQSYQTAAGQVSVALEGKNIFVDLGQSRVGSFDLTATLNSLKAKGASGTAQTQQQHEALVLEAAGGSKTRLALTLLTATASDTQANIQITGYLLLPLTP